jgi:hypothetical protein
MHLSMHQCIDALMDASNPCRQLGPDGTLKIRETLTKFAALLSAEAAYGMRKIRITLSI